MTNFEIKKFPFDTRIIEIAGEASDHIRNWPAVYTIDDTRHIYIGETLSATSRMKQHSKTEKKKLTRVHLILDKTFNKSACLDLESTLIGWFAGDDKFTVLNRNTGVSRADYYDRELYEIKFKEIFDGLRGEGLFEHSISEIENRDMFKLSPFKALTLDQEVAVEGILEGLSKDRNEGTNGTIVVQGDPGTGKTIVAIYLVKLLSDIDMSIPEEVIEESDKFSDFFLGDYRELLGGMRIGMVIPQQSLRETIKTVFKKIPNLHRVSVMSPFEVAKIGRDHAKHSSGHIAFDLLVVDEAHRLNQRANQSSGFKNKEFADLNIALFGEDDPNFTQLDWIRECSKHQVLLVDGEQSIRPADLPSDELKAVIDVARHDERFHHLSSQMRVKGGHDYIRYIHDLLSDHLPAVPVEFADNYDLRFFDDIGEMYSEIRKRDSEFGLARLVAGYAWPWKSKKDKTEFDIELDGLEFRWNSKDKDWINSKGSLEEVGSIHTVQGYDLNFAGVIVGPDLGFDESRGRLVYDENSYFDVMGKQKKNGKRGILYTDEDLLQFVRNIYRVLLTRGMRGTYVYVCDLELRERLRPYFPGSMNKNR